MQCKNLLGISDLSAADLHRVLEMAASMKQGGTAPTLAGKSIALLFEKPSLRTRVSFEVGMHQLGGHAVVLGPQEVGLGEREPVADVAHVLSRYVHGIAARTYAQATLLELAEYASVPVINALSDDEHPCQALADLITVQECKGDVQVVRIAFIGDGNNVTASPGHASTWAGAHFTLASPPA